MTEPVRENNRPTLKYTMPTIVRVPGITYKKRGKFKTKSGKCMGLVVHFTVSGRTAQAAKNVVAYMAGEGIGCPVMDEKGIIYVPENYDFQKDVVYHAGYSSWRGVSGVSFYCMGMEICNWGTDGKKRGAKDLRTISKKTDNRKIGTYQKYTDAQEKSLINFIKWQLATNSEFKVDWVVGHDEISPNRKSDPGGSLSISMPQLRKLFQEAK